MELIENSLQLLVTFLGACLAGLDYRKSGRQAYFLLLCFYGCFALGGAAQYVAYALPAALMAAGRLPALRPRQKGG